VPVIDDVVLEVADLFGVSPVEMAAIFEEIPQAFGSRSDLRD
jgi:hypothetical protein